LGALSVDERRLAAATLDAASAALARSACAAELSLPEADPVVRRVLDLRHQVRLARACGAAWSTLRDSLVASIVHAPGGEWGIPVTDAGELLRRDGAELVIALVRDPRAVAAGLHAARAARQAERDADRAVRERGELIATLQDRAADRTLDGSSRRSAARELASLVPELAAAALDALDAEQLDAEQHAARREASIRAGDAAVNAERDAAREAQRQRALELGSLG
jgi:hypothetical protein